MHLSLDVITNAFSSDGLMHTTRNGRAGNSWAHKTPYRSGECLKGAEHIGLVKTAVLADALVIGNWIVGSRDGGHFGIKYVLSELVAPVE